jgi:hypothetical protein
MRNKAIAWWITIVGLAIFVGGGFYTGHGADVNHDVGRGGFEIGGGISLLIVGFVIFIAGCCWLDDSY